MEPFASREEMLFEAALECATVEEREAFLRRSCSDDAMLRARVQELLEVSDRAGSFAAGASMADAHSARANFAQRVQRIVESLSEQAGDCVGRYKLVGRLGEGGMATVWRAEQSEPVRRAVAVKILKVGLDTMELVARFEAERQALALMDHPNIARVFDGGVTDSGRPYFVMELVIGEAVTDYCDCQKLNPRERLELFIDICHAVQHAHHKGVIHRDLKPSNVLVTVQDGQPMPKIIDFGIAKAIGQRLTAKTLVTQFHQLMGTPCYMSPEQAGLGRGDVDTRSDVYALGVLLYELLTGRTPFDRGNLMNLCWDEMRRFIRESEPPRPSARLDIVPAADLLAIAQLRRSEPAQLIHLLRGDLDWIVMRALEKDRDRRYATANGLAIDLRRHMNHEPVFARPPSLAYLLRKLVRRNKAAFASGAVVIVTLIAGLLLSTILLLRERAAHHRALAAEHIAQQRLREAHLAEARATRYSHRRGQRFDGLQALREAAAIKPGLDVRNEAIAALALPDLRVAREWRLPAATITKTFDPQLKLLAFTDTNGTITIQRADDQREVASLPSPDSRTWIPEFSPDGEYIAAEYMTQPRRIRVWNIELARLVLEVSHGRRFAFAPDSHEIAISTDTRTILIHSLIHGERLATIAESGSPHLRYSPDGRKLAAGAQSLPNVRVYDRASLKLVRTFAVPKGVFALAWHPDGSRLAAAGDDSAIHTFDFAAETKSTMLRGHQANVVRLAYNHAGNLLASSSWDNDICLWDSERATLLLKIPLAHIHHFSPDDRLLGIEQGEATLKLLEVADGRERRILGMPSQSGPSAWGASFHPASRMFASAEPDGAGVWDAFTGKKLAFLAIGETYSALFNSRTGDLLTTSKRGVERWPIKQSRTSPVERIMLGPPCPVSASANLKRSALSADGTLLAAVHGNDGAELLDITDSHLPRQTRLKHNDTAFVAISPGGEWIATGTWHGTGVRIWDRRGGRQVFELPIPTSATVTFSPDGRWLVTSTSKAYEFWNVGTWQFHRQIPMDEGTRGPGLIAFSEKGEWTAVLLDHRSLRLIEPLSGSELATLESPDSRNIWTLTASPDGRFLAAPTDGRLIQLWDLALIRQHLAAMNLDWPAPARARLQATNETTLQVEVKME